MSSAAAFDAPLRERIEKQFRKAGAPFILPPWGRAIPPDNRGDKFQRNTLYTSHVCMKPAAYRSENNQSTPESLPDSWSAAGGRIVAISLRSSAESQTTARMIAIGRARPFFHIHSSLYSYFLPPPLLSRSLSRVIVREKESYGLESSRCREKVFSRELQPLSETAPGYF